jgi:hypothetical protein
LRENHWEVGVGKNRVTGKNIIEIHCMVIWKDHNETYLKIFARKLKEGSWGEELRKSNRGGKCGPSS